MRLYFVLFLGLTLLYGCNNEDPPSQGAMFLELTVLPVCWKELARG
jgi:hypothetical protein